MTGYTFDQLQTRNGMAALEVIHRWARQGRWTERYAHRVGRLVIQACLAESNLYNDANPNVPGSEAYPHDPGHEGTDHASVGVLQQQVPMWGPVERCQNVPRAVVHFLEALLPIDVHDENVAMEIQAVQRSGISDGSNYRAQRDRALAFLRQHWSAARRPGSRRHQRLLRTAPPTTRSGAAA